MSGAAVSNVMSGVVSSSSSVSSALVDDLTTATIEELVQAAARGNQQAIRLLAKREQQARAINPKPQPTPQAGMASTPPEHDGAMIDYLA
jgi:hypothetical protein